MSTDFLTYLNSGISEFQKKVYAMDDMAAYPWKEKAPVYTLVPHNQNYNTRTFYWKVDLGTYDGIQFGDNFSLASGTVEGDEASVTFGKMSQALEFDRLSTKIMSDPKASAYKLVEDTLRKAAQQRAETLESILVSGDSTGAIGTIDTAGVLDNGGGSYTLTISSATWAYGYWVRRVMLNVGDSSDIFDVTDIDDILYKVTVQRRTGGSKVPAAADILYRQSGKNNYPVGLKEIIEGSGNLHGIPRKHGWQSLKVDWTNQAISEAKLEELFLKVYMRSGEYPDMLLLSPKQALRLNAIVRDQSIRTMDAMASRTASDGSDRSYPVPNINYIQIMGKNVKLVPHCHIPNGSGYFFNTSYLELMSIGPGEFVSTTGASDANMLYLGNITGQDRFRMLWVYYYAIRTTRPQAHGGFVNAISTTPENIL